MSVKIEAETESGVLRCMSPNYDCYFGLQILLLLPFFVQSIAVIVLARTPGCFIICGTRSYAALQAADLDWIVGPGYSLGGYIFEKKP